jgi:hypothetical protein
VCCYIIVLSTNTGASYDYNNNNHNHIHTQPNANNATKAMQSRLTRSAGANFA